MSAKFCNTYEQLGKFFKAINSFIPIFCPSHSWLRAAEASCETKEAYQEGWGICCPEQTESESQSRVEYT